MGLWAWDYGARNHKLLVLLGLKDLEALGLGNARFPAEPACRAYALTQLSSKVVSLMRRMVKYRQERYIRIPSPCLGRYRPTYVYT